MELNRTKIVISYCRHIVVNYKVINIAIMIYYQAKSICNWNLFWYFRTVRRHH